MYLSHLCLHKNLASKLTGENIYSQSLCAKNQGALGSIRVPPEVVTKLLVTSFCLRSLTGCEGAISNCSQARSEFKDAGGALWSSLKCSRTEVLNNLSFRMSMLLVTQIFKAETMQVC